MSQIGPNDGVFAQWYSASGAPQNGEFHVTTSGIFGQRYSSDGLLLGGEFQVNTTASNDRVNASVAMDNQGDFVVVWSGSGIGDSDGIFDTVGY